MRRRGWSLSLPLTFFLSLERQREREGQRTRDEPRPKRLRTERSFRQLNRTVRHRLVPYIFLKFERQSPLTMRAIGVAGFVAESRPPRCISNPEKLLTARRERFDARARAHAHCPVRESASERRASYREPPSLPRSNRHRDPLSRGIVLHGSDRRTTKDVSPIASVPMSRSSRARPEKSRE